MAVPLRADFDAVGVRCWARKSKDGPQARVASGAGGELRWRQLDRACGRFRRIAQKAGHSLSAHRTGQADPFLPTK